MKLSAEYEQLLKLSRALKRLGASHIRVGEFEVAFQPELIMAPTQEAVKPPESPLSEEAQAALDRLPDWSSQDLDF
jgi:hypothetical protein